MAAAVGQEFWIVAAGCSKQNGPQSDKENFSADLKRHQALASKNGQEGPWKFDVPDGERSLLFGSFDNLIRLTDDLQKYDQQVDGIVHRLERQTVELDPRADFKVKSQRQERTFVDYIKHWQWDEAKFPKTRSISDNLTLLMATVNRLDEEARNKTAQYNDFKTQKSNLVKKDGANLATKDLIDVLTPEVVNCSGNENDDFIYSEHLTTIPVILSRGADVEFLKCYETMAENVVPGSARRFTALDDKDGNSVWRVVVFRSSVDAFRKQCREKRFIVRDFEYSEEGFAKLKKHRETIDESVKRQHELVKNLYQAAWSDTMVALMHIKAMRIFVESVLRFGMPPKFASFIILPTTPGPARKALAEILGKSGMQEAKPSEHQDEGDEYYPYVSISFTPFTVSRDKN